MQFQKKMKKNLAAAVLAGLIVTPYGTPSYAADAAAAETHTEAAAPSMEETLAEWMATHPTQDTAEPERAEAPLVTDTAAQQRKPLTKAEVRDSIYAVSMSQTEILNLIDRLNARLDRYEQEQERVRVAVPAPTSGALVHPAPASHVNDTQDAVNAQGNATMTFAYSPTQLYKIYCRRGYLTDLAFRKGETIQFVGGGDTAGWAFRISTSSRSSRSPRQTSSSRRTSAAISSSSTVQIGTIRWSRGHTRQKIIRTCCAASRRMRRHARHPSMRPMSKVSISPTKSRGRTPSTVPRPSSPTECASI